MYLNRRKWVRIAHKVVVGVYDWDSCKKKKMFLSPSLQCCDVSLTNLLFLEMCVLSNNIMDYYFVAQGKTTIPNVDDAEECRLTDVSER